MCQQRTRSDKNTEDYGQRDNQVFHFPRLLKIKDPVERTIAVTFRAKRVAEVGELLRRRRLLLFEVLEALSLFTELFPQRPGRPQEEGQMHRPGLRVGLRVLDGNVVHQVVVINPPDALYNVQSVAVRVTDSVDPRFIVEVCCVNDECVSLPLPNRVSHPRGAETGIMRAAVCENLMPQGVVLEQHHDLPGRLKNLQGEGVKKNPRETGWITAMVNGVGRFRQGVSVRSEGGLGSFVFRQAPSRHGRFLYGKLINNI